jgi:hypothetical protein
MRPPLFNNRTDILAEAESLVNGDRNDSYGDPIDDFATTAEMWSTYLRRVVDKRESTQLKPHDVAVMMTLLKISRISWSPEKRDHWADSAGYIACGWDCVVREEGYHNA